MIFFNRKKTETPLAGLGSHPNREVEKKSVKLWQQRIESAKQHWKSDFDRMREDIDFYDGKQSDDADHYIVNFVKRTVQEKLAQQYFQSPDVAVTPRNRRLNTVWDGTDEQLNQALASTQINPMDMNALEIIADAEQVLEERKRMARVAETALDLQQYWLDQDEIKDQIKQLILTENVCGVGWARLRLQRSGEIDPTDGVMPDPAKQQADRAEILGSPMENDDPETREAELAEIEAIYNPAPPKLQPTEEICVDLIDPWDVILDPKTRNLKRLPGCDWLAIQHQMSVTAAKSFFGVDLSEHTAVGNPDFANQTPEEDRQVTVYEVFDKVNQTILWINLEYEFYLKLPESHDALEGFWGIKPFTTNRTINPKKVYPQSLVRDLRHIQIEFNEKKQDAKDHREANKPGYMIVKGSASEEDIDRIAGHAPHEIVEVMPVHEQPPEKLISRIPKTGFNPAEHETASVLSDMNLVVSGQSASLQRSGDVTATEAGIVAGAQQQATGNASDELHDVLQWLVKSHLQLALTEFSLETVKIIVGPGAVWPEMDGVRYSQRLMTQVQAGSAGRPNEGAEIAKLERVMSMMLQIAPLQEALGRISDPTPLLREIAKILRVDVEALSAEATLDQWQMMQLAQAQQQSQSPLAATASPTGQPPQAGDNPNNLTPDTPIGAAGMMDPALINQPDY